MHTLPGNTVGSRQLKGVVIRGEGLEVKHSSVEEIRNYSLVEGINPGPNKSLLQFCSTKSDYHYCYLCSEPACLPPLILLHLTQNTGFFLG